MSVRICRTLRISAVHMLALAMLVAAMFVATAEGFFAAASAAPVGVAVRNESTGGSCAEADNITLKLVAERIAKFSIVARHPAYMGMLSVDRSDPDFDTCDMSGDPVVPAVPTDAHPDTAKPRRVTLFESPDLWVIGFTFPSFWRPAAVPVRIGTEVTQGLHMLQLWIKQNGRTEEVLVVYPPDGYWRARPLSPAHLRSTAYGSSFLVGPVEQAERPLVALSELGFAPQTRTFTLHFAAGGKARLQLARASADDIRLEVAFDPPATGTFAALRSMYVTEDNADVARVSWRTLPASGRSAQFGEAPVMSFTGAQDASWLWAGRLVPSRHNTSAPDFIFRDFATEP